MENKNPIVQYDNTLNNVKLGALKESELNMFMTLCACAVHKGSEELIISYSDFKELYGCKKNLTETEVINKIEDFWNKIKISQTIKTDKSFIGFSLFNYVIAKDGYIQFQVNPVWYKILNELENQFTAFELKEFVQIKGKYSKNLYRILKQYRMTGYCWISVDNFRSIMGLSDNYQNKYIYSKIIIPAVEELKPYFDKLTINVIKNRDTSINKYEFRWVAEKSKKQEIKEKSEIIEKIHTLKSYKEYNENKHNNWFPESERSYNYKELENAAVNQFN